MLPFMPHKPGPSTLAAVVLALTLTALTACRAPVGVDGVTVPSDAARTCEQHCRSIGLALGAVAIMANNVGCVCDAGGPPGAASSSTVTAGMATIAMQDAAEQQRRQAEQQRQRQQRQQ